MASSSTPLHSHASYSIVEGITVSNKCLLVESLGKDIGCLIVSVYIFQAGATMLDLITEATSTKVKVFSKFGDPMFFTDLDCSCVVHTSDDWSWNRKVKLSKKETYKGSFFCTS